LAALSAQYESLQSVTEEVMQNADSTARQSIADELADIERLWLDADSQLTEQLQQLESTARVWREVEAVMESIVEQLKKTRTSLVQPLSDNCEELERELCRCQVCLTVYCTTFLSLILTVLAGVVTVTCVHLSDPLTICLSVSCFDS